ncbi:MAG: endolytic transglycosylase MltG [Anaerolineae bacterium]
MGGEDLGDWGRTALRIALIVLALVAIIAIPVGAGWYLLRQSRQVSAPVGEITVPGAEEALLGLYLRLHQAEIEAPAGDDPTPVTFTVRPGETAADIALRLQRQGLIRDAELFRLVIRARGMDTRLEAGDYQLRANMTMDEIITALQRGLPPTTTVTVPEGWRAEEIAALLSGEGLVDGAEFMRLVQNGGFDYDFLRDRPPDHLSLEGYLFPDTYQIPANFSTAQVVDLMLRTFDQRFTPEMRQQAAERGLTIHEVVTLASIVEREAVVASERPTIASVFLNRLAAGMKLDADPTVQYALGYQEGESTWWKRPLLLEDLEIESPYNTYKNAGLPPGPICSPGLASLQAVLTPAETDYYYFVAVGDGSHAFARTLEEHLENQSKYQP